MNAYAMGLSSNLNKPKALTIVKISTKRYTAINWRNNVFLANYESIVPGFQAYNSVM